MAEVVVEGTPLIQERTEQPRKRFRLKAGKKNHYHMHQGRTFFVSAGDTVELTERQAKAFADKFEPVDGGFDDDDNAPSGELDRAAGIVNRESGNVTSTDGVKTVLPGSKPAEQPESPAVEANPSAKAISDAAKAESARKTEATKAVVEGKK
jgi:hypothetical protein